MVDCLHAAGLLDAEGRQAGLDLVSPPRRWQVWTERLLAVVGTTLVLAGVVYFFAFNWARLPGLTKLALAGLGLLLTLVRPWTRGTDDPLGKLLICAAGMMVGVFLAVFGQVYQTGADAYELFAAWGALVLGWAVLARSAPLWALWVVVVNVGVVLYVDQAAPFPGDWEALAIVVLVAFNAVALGAREWAVAGGAVWLAPRWTRFVLGYAVIALATLPLLELAVDHGPPSMAEAVTSAVGLAALGGVAWAYRHRHPDLGMLGGVAMSACLVVEVAVFQLLEDWWDELEALAFFLLAGFTIALFASAVSWLRHVSARIDAEQARA